MNDHYPFALRPLPYAYDSLSPHLDARTVHIHHDILQSGYVDRLNQLLAPCPQYHDWPLRRLVTEWACLPDTIRTNVRNQAGGVYNHQLYFDSMAPAGESSPSPALLAAITRDFGSWNDFRRALKSMALRQFGSGYVWLLTLADGTLSLTTTANQDVPARGTPLFNGDLWEHAYFLQYLNRREEYFDNWFPLIRWAAAEARYAAVLQALPCFPAFD